MEVAKQTGKLTPELFGPPYRYIPFKESADIAVRAALRSPAVSTSQATEITDWFVVTITLTGTQVIKAIREHILTVHWFENDTHRAGGLRWGGEMQLCEHEQSWTQITLEALGLEEWLTHRLGADCTKFAKGVCKGCQNVGKVWVWNTASAGAKRSGYCDSCWHEFFLTEESEVASTSEGSRDESGRA